MSDVTLKILAVDDSLLIRSLVADAGAALGVETLQAENGQAALDVLEKESSLVGLVVLDWHMPVMGGIDFLKQMKADLRFADIPVMMLTTESEQENVLRAILAGADDYLAKPFVPEDLMTKLTENLSKSKQS